MATGDNADILTRLRAYLPSRWFGSTSDSVPLLIAILNGFAFVLSEIYQLYGYAKQQTRIAWATGGWLDIIAFDFFGNGLPRKPSESDGSYRARIKAELVKKKVTRQGIAQALYALTGRNPIITEPWRPLDTGAYAQGSPNTMAGPFGAPIGYGVAGSYGSLKLNAQFFVTAYRPSSAAAFSSIGGYGVSVGGYSTGSQLMYSSLAEYSGGISDASIYACVAATKAEGTIAWVRISN